MSEPNAAVRAPLRVSANGRYFVDAAGEPFFWLGDTAWPLFTLYPKADAEAYLADRAARGFTVIQAILAWGNPEPGGSLEGTPPGPNYAGEPIWKRAPAEPNDAFFEHVDHLVRMAARLGLVMALFPTSGFSVNNSRVIDATNARAYGRYLGRRYRDTPNVVWVNGGDREPLGYEEVYAELARGLREGDGGAHLLTYHPCGWRSSSYYYQEADWLDFHMIETWTSWDMVHPAVLADYCLTPARPVVLGEPAYENGPEYPRGPITPLIVRRQAWWTHMAGGFFTYGQDQMWRMEPGWTGTFGTPGAQHMAHFRAIAGSRPWWTMIPDQGMFAEGAGSGRSLNAALRAVDRSCSMLYLSGPCHFVVNVDRIAAPRAKATWANPQTGETLDAGAHETGNGIPGATFPLAAAQCFQTPPFWEDAVLILDGAE